jgi:hypothetical protein
MLTVSLGDYSNGNRFLNEGLEIKRANKDGWGIAFCLRQLGVLGFYQGAYDEADRLLNEGLEVSRTIGQRWAIAYSLIFSALRHTHAAHTQKPKTSPGRADVEPAGWRSFHNCICLERIGIGETAFE